MLYSAGVHISRMAPSLSSNLLQTLFSFLAEGYNCMLIHAVAFTDYLQPDELQRTEMVQEARISKVKGLCPAKFPFWVIPRQENRRQRESRKRKGRGRRKEAEPNFPS